MASLSKAEFVQIMMATTTCLHYEPDYKINKPLLLMVGDQDATGNIRKIMPIWAEHEPDCRFVVIPNAKHAANLDNPDFFHFHARLMEFLLNRGMSISDERTNRPRIRAQKTRRSTNTRIEPLTNDLPSLLPYSPPLSVDGIRVFVDPIRGRMPHALLSTHPIHP